MPSDARKTRAQVAEAMASYLRARVRGRASCEDSETCVSWSGRRCPIKASGEDAECHALAMLGAEAVAELLAAGVLAKEENGGLAEGPLEMSVADLGAGGTQDLAGGGLLALDQRVARFSDLACSRMVRSMERMVPSK